MYIKGLFIIIRGTPLKWFKSYLSNRKQYVKYNNSDSLQQDITFGVPQGSILGPLLFIIYINDLPFCVKHCKTILFADDTTIYKSGKQVTNIYEDMNNELQVLADWFRANKLSLNISKTKSMLFCRSPPPENEELILAMSNTIIQRIKCLQFLGLYIDKKLDWHEHINKCKNKLTSAFYVINKVNSYLPVSALKTIYYTLVYPYLTYGIILWGSTYKTYLTILFIIPKKIVRSILKKNYRKHSHPLFTGLKLVKLNDVYELEIGNFWYNYVPTSSPHYLSDILTFTHDIQIHETTQCSHIRPFTSLTVKYSNSFLCKGPFIWNRIPFTIQQKNNINSFAVSLKAIVVKGYEELAEAY